MKRLLIKLNADKRGFILPMLISFIVAALIFTAAALEIIQSNLTTVNTNVQSQQAFNIAEAGANYYLWHLSHNATDYKDGQTVPATPDPVLGYGPYVHQYLDNNTVNTGTFTLWINPQGGGSTVVTVRSIGQVKNTNIIRTVQVQIGAASFASYGVVSDSALWFGNTESALGPVFSNQGVRMDGSSTDTVSSANTTYLPPFANGGCSSSNCPEPGVWCDPSVITPVNCNTRNKTNWIFPTTTVNFNQVNSSLCSMKKTAFADFAATASLATMANACSQTPTTRTGAYLPQRSSSGAYSVTKGYLIKLNSNGTYDLLNVNAEDDRLTPYTSALTTSPIATGIATPPSGVIFAEDNVWVLSNPTFHGRVTIAAGRLAQANSMAEIVISGPIVYSTKNGSDSIGLVSETSVFVAPYAPPVSGAFNYEVDAAVLAESGNVTYGENSESTVGNGTFQAGYRAQQSKCSRGWTNSNQTMLFYGSVATRQLWTWTWDFGSGHSGHCGDNSQGNSGHWISGILNNSTQYDYNLLYNPPPSYPITSSFNVLSWREVLTHP
jgi:hypothetical protein